VAGIHFSLILVTARIASLLKLSFSPVAVILLNVPSLSTINLISQVIKELALIFLSLKFSAINLWNSALPLEKTASFSILE